MTQKPTRTSPSNDAAKAFEDLRREISLQRTAIEGLTAAKDKLPDYSPTLRAMDARLDQMDERLHRIDQHPAMQLTPLTLAAQINEGLITYRAEDRKAIGEARDTLAHTLGRVEGMIKQRRSTEEQDWWIIWVATGGLLCGALFALIGIAMFG